MDITHWCLVSTKLCCNHRNQWLWDVTPLALTCLQTKQVIVKTTGCNITGVLLFHAAGVLYRVHKKPCNPFLEKWFKKKTFKRKSLCYMKCWKFLPPSRMHAFIPFVVDTCFYYQSKHNTLNNMHASTTTYFSHHQVKLHRHKWKSIYWGRGLPFTVFFVSDVAQ
jgi:hypothetical protein